MKKFCFTVDDNIRFLKEITAAQPESIFEHPYLALFKSLHEKFGLAFSSISSMSARDLIWP